MPFAEFGAIVFPSFNSDLTPHQQAELEMACYQLNELNLLLSAPPPHAIIVDKQQIIIEEGSVSSDGASSGDSTPIVTPTFSYFGDEDLTGTTTELASYCHPRDEPTAGPTACSPFKVSRHCGTDICLPTVPRHSSRPGTCSPRSPPISRRQAVVPQKQRLTIADFELRKVLGRGNQGRVYLASHDASIVAVKVICKEKLVQPVDLAFTLVEQRVLKTLHSPFIVRLQSSFSDSSYYYMVTDFHSGGDLHHLLLDAGNFSADAARFYTAEIVLGLDYLHRNGIIHRDIKLENVLVKADGHIVLADLGLALDLRLPSVSEYEGHGTQPVCCGTIPYMAPELLAGKNYGQQVDVWSLGVCVYLMLVGTLPYEGEDNKKTVAMILTSPVPSRVTEADIEPPACSLIVTLLAKDPAKRCTLKDVCIHPFFDSLDWQELERRQILPPFTPAPCEAAFLEEVYLLPWDRLSPGLPAPCYVEPHPEYIWIRPSVTTAETLAARFKPTEPIARPPYIIPSSSSSSSIGISLISIDLSQSPTLPNSETNSKTPLTTATSLQTITSLSSLVSINVIVPIHLLPLCALPQDNHEGLSFTKSRPSFIQWLVNLGRKVVTRCQGWVPRLSS